MNKQVTNKKHQNQIEALNSIPEETLQNLQKLASDSVNEAIDWKKWLGLEEEENKFGDLSEGQELSFDKPEKKEKVEIEAAFNYKAEVLNSERKIAGEDRQALDAQIKEILIEIKKLIGSSEVLAAQFQKVIVEEEIPVNPGKYHLNFFESFLQFIRDLREKVENSNSWMTALQSKKGARSYWNMAKKFGTTFSMSHERNVATQSG